MVGTSLVDESFDKFLGQGAQERGAADDRRALEGSAREDHTMLCPVSRIRRAAL